MASLLYWLSCDLTSQIFHQMSHLKVHWWTHTGFKHMVSLLYGLSCDLTSQTFHQVRNLKVHWWTHTCLFKSASWQKGQQGMLRVISPFFHFRAYSTLEWHGSIVLCSMRRLFKILSVFSNQRKVSLIFNYSWMPGHMCNMQIASLLSGSFPVI